MFFVDTHSKFSSFNASKELPFDLEDALLLWINKISAVLNENQLKKQKQHAEQLLQNQDKAKRFRFRRDQLQPKVQTVFPLMEELLKDISDGKSLLGILMFYHPTVINIEGTLWCIIMLTPNMFVWLCASDHQCKITFSIILYLFIFSYLVCFYKFVVFGFLLFISYIFWHVSYSAHNFAALLY